jgi:hypothetical protein
VPYLVARFILIAGMAGCLMPLRASRAVGSHRQSLLTGPTLILLVQHAGSYLGTPCKRLINKGAQLEQYAEERGRGEYDDM